MMIKIGEYSIRKIDEEDLALILKWRNSERIHSKMLTEHYITMEEHTEWFKKIRNNKMITNFIFCYKSQAIGYLGYNVNWKEKICYPSLYIGSLDGIKANAGIVLGKICIKYAFDFMGMNKICAEVLMDNESVWKLNNFLGYKNEKVLEKRMLKKGRYIDILVQSIVKVE